VHTKALYEFFIRIVAIVRTGFKSAVADEQLRSRAVFNDFRFYGLVLLEQIVIRNQTLSGV
jgi:hypothetical protein